MAVERPELTPNELDWIVKCVKAAPKKERHDFRRAIRELERKQKSVWEIYHREMAQLAKMRASFVTAPREDGDEHDAASGSPVGAHQAD